MSDSILLAYPLNEGYWCSMQMTVRQLTQRESLQAVSNRLLPALRSIGERYCLFTPTGPQPQARTVGAYTAQSGTSTIYKVAILPAGDSSAYTGTDIDSAWAVIDHKSKSILFGPQDGIQVSEDGAGIGPYVFGQLIRLIRTKEDPGSYRIIELPFPSQPVEPEASTKWEVRSRKAAAILENHGFHVSKTAAGLVANAQRFSSLTERWNSDKISFLPASRLASLFNETVAGLEEIRAGAKAMEAHAQELQRQLDGHGSIAAEVVALKAKEKTQQEMIDQLMEQVSNLLPLQGQLDAQKETIVSSPSDAPILPPATIHDEILKSSVPPLVQVHRHHLGTVERVVLAIIGLSIAGAAIISALAG
ncbi:hypothetical protein PZF67_004550 [Pseudomonas aeruginosa]|uniref:hypothetical protein n=1 Tax=Pseudomonas aeruginosa TaxID=287 RepID=UPI0025C91766|nr:hypothetical protein [Pseudomonas aeruginosa]